MFALHRTLSLRYLGGRWGRTLLVVLSIALGVATLVATRALDQNMVQAAHRAANPVPLLGDLLVTNGSDGVPRDLIEQLKTAGIPGLREVRPLVVNRVVLPALDNRTALLVGVELELGSAADTPLKDEVDFQLVPRPLSFPRGYPTFVGQALAQELPGGIAEFKVRVGSQLRPLSGFGTVTARGPLAALGGDVLFLKLADAAKLLGKPDLVTRIDLSLEPGTDVQEARRRVEETVGDRAQVETAQTQEESVKDLMAGVELGALLGGVCALVVGLFLVYNALSVNVAERRHEIGVLRSLGATRFQVARLFVGEALFLGLTGSLLGLPLGWGVAYLALGTVQELLSDLFPLELRQVPTLAADTVLLALVCGTATALLAALVPALHAAREEPADAVRRAPRTSGWGYRLPHAGVSAAIILGGLALVPLREHLPNRWGVFGAPMFILVGMLVATPLLAELAAHLLAPAARLFLGVPGRLAADNLVRSPGRTGLVIAALAAGVALMVQTAGVMVSSEDAALSWLDRTLSCDLMVTANSPITSAGKSQPMGEEVGPLLETLPEVRRAVPVRFKLIDFRGKKVSLTAVDVVGFHEAGGPEEAVPGLELFPQLRRPGTALVSENFAQLYRVAAGDRLRLPGPRGPVEVEVVGTVLDYGWNRGTVFVDRAFYVAHYDDREVDLFHVYLRPESAGAVEAVREEIDRRWHAQESLVAATRQELRDGARGMIRRLYSIGYAQELVVGVVAGLGVVMALLNSVIQRRRELGLLRAVGASPLQVLRTVLAEAVLMGIVGALIGLALGIPMEWYVVRVLLLEEAGFALPLKVPWLEAGVVTGLALAIATLAGLGPAVQAVRLRIADAIAYE